MNRVGNVWYWHTLTAGHAITVKWLPYMYITAYSNGYSKIQYDTVWPRICCIVSCLYKNCPNEILHGKWYINLTWVVFPHPVSPDIKTTWLLLIRPVTSFLKKSTSHVGRQEQQQIGAIYRTELRDISTGTLDFHPPQKYTHYNLRVVCIE